MVRLRTWKNARMVLFFYAQHKCVSKKSVSRLFRYKKCTIIKSISNFPEIVHFALLTLHFFCRPLPNRRC